MRYVLILIIVFFFGCQKEDMLVNDPKSISNTNGWIVISYFADGGYQTVKYITYGFDFINYSESECVNEIKVRSNCGLFHGCYDIKNLNDKTIIDLNLPPDCRLDKIRGEWILVSVSNQWIHLIRTGNNQELVFKR